MTIELFMYILTIGSAVSSLLTQALKKAFKELPSNILALVSAVFIGVIGTCIIYNFLGIPYTSQNIISIFLMAVCNWYGSMCGYDKLMQTIRQIKG